MPQWSPKSMHIPQLLLRGIPPMLPIQCRLSASLAERLRCSQAALLQLSVLHASEAFAALHLVGLSVCALAGE